MRVVVAMSGGVDSSVVAGLMVEAGHEVIGVAMKTHGLEPRGNRACCTPDDMRDARTVADILNIPFYVLNYADLFQEVVVRPFAEAYREGRTPNPCVECNDKVKFRPLLARAQLLGADCLATGHYARVSENETTGERALLRGCDPKKDQSYFLYRLNQEQLKQVMFPLGGMVKADVRAHARRLGLPVAEKSESQEICFVGSEGYAKTVEKILDGQAGKPGFLENEEGHTVGTHSGVHHFTLGQRRGLGVSSGNPEPQYVTHIDASSGLVRIGTRKQMECDFVEIEDVFWASGQAMSDPDSESEKMFVDVQQRYHDTPRKARIEVRPNNCVKLHFETRGPRGAPGQAAVFYQGDSVFGGGRITNTYGLRSEAAS